MILTKSSSNRKAQLPGATNTAVSFQVEDEDHTLGNALRYFITKKYAQPRNTLSKTPSSNALKISPDVEFCGYTIPHPSETKMNIRIQTWGKKIFGDAPVDCRGHVVKSVVGY